MKSFNDYEQFAEAYVKQTESSSHNAYYERPAMFSILSDLKFNKVLDAGCAGGIYTEWLLNRGAEVVAVDINSKMVELTKKRIRDLGATEALRDRGKVYQADLNQPLTFLNNDSFDLVVSSLTIHYLPDWNPVFQEFNRILSTAGLFLFSTHHPCLDFLLFNKPDYFKCELIEDEWHSFGDKPVKVRFYRRPLSNMIAALTNTGFIIENIIEPRPTEECKKLYPQDYAKLSTKPWFLIILARKKR